MRTEFEILQGHALTVLKVMPKESVQCAITSPPFYGLRSYKTEPQIWDGDGFCDHVFGGEIANPKLDTRTVDLKILQGAAVGSNVASQHWAQGTLGSFCRCGSWRGELGLEPRFQDYIRHLLQIFTEVRRVLKPDGTCFVNLGDSFNTNNKGDKRLPEQFQTQRLAKQNGGQGEVRQIHNNLCRKSLMNIPHRFFIGMTDELQFIQRNNLIWYKPACMPSSAKDRWTVDFESIGFFTKSVKYKFNQQLEATAPITPIRLAQDVAKQNGSHIQGGGYAKPMKSVGDPDFRNARTTWSINFEPQSDEHYASYPTKLVEKMLFAGSSEGDVVLDPFAGTGTTLLTALRHRRNALGIELQPKYVEILNKRCGEVQVEMF